MAVDAVSDYCPIIKCRILAVDHGEKRIGLAISDSTGTIANPLKVIEHVSRMIDAAQVADVAVQNQVELIVIGQSFDEEGKPNLAGRRAARFAEALKTQTQIPIVMWDEFFSTQSARAARIEMGVSRKKRAGHLDELAATIILQSYLDPNQENIKHKFVMRRFIPYIAIAFIVLCVVLVVFVFPSKAAQLYGPPSERLSFLQVIQYSAELVWDDGLLTTPLDSNVPQQSFTVQEGESVASIADRLQQNGLISDARMFRDYLIYTGLDTSIQAGNYDLSPAMSIVDIAHKMQNATSTQVTFVILPGWRMEEIAASLPTSGLNITPDAFLAAAKKSRPGFDFLVGRGFNGRFLISGFLYPAARHRY